MIYLCKEYLSIGAHLTNIMKCGTVGTISELKKMNCTYFVFADFAPTE